MQGSNLGIPGAGRVSPGTHLCALYSGPAERERLLLPFLEEGLRQGDRVLCLIDDVETPCLGDRESGRPGLASGRSAQPGGERASDPLARGELVGVDHVIDLLVAAVDAAVADDLTVLRVASDVSWVSPLRRPHDDLIRYESGVGRAVTQGLAIVMCLYDLTRLGADALVDVLRTHPMVLLDHALVENPYFRNPTKRLTAAPASAGWASLTPAELRVASHVSRGTTNRMIAEDLQVSHHTVDAHLKHIYLKLDIHSRVELTVLAIRHRLTIS